MPTSWTDKDYAWRVNLPGRGHSSPVIAKGRVFVTAAEAGTLHVLGLDAATGTTRWDRSFAVDKPRGHEDNSLASSTPAVDGERVYVAWGSPAAVVLLALTHDGVEVWRRDLGPYRAGHGFAASPIVHKDCVILACEEKGKDALVALDAASGAERWRVARKSRNSYATPCLLELPGRPTELVAVSYEDGVTGLDPASGAVRWQADVFDKRHVEASIASPIVLGDLILVTAGWLGVRYETIALRLAGSAATAEKLYTLDRGAPLVPTPIVHDGLVYLLGDRGVVRCSDLRTGETYWNERVEGSFYASPVIAGRHLYSPSREGDMVVLAAGKRFEPIATIPLGEGTHATPAVVGSRLFVRTFSRLMCLERK